MTVYKFDDGSASRIHALVIGVGVYPYCGSAVPWTAPPKTLLRSLGELTCAPLSAVHVAQWLIEADWSKSDVKLGTVDVLLSPEREVPWPTDPALLKPERAVYGNVRSAWKRWVARCDQDKDNIALLYFCGHGWGSTQKYLIVEDFAEDIGQWKDRLIDFTHTRKSMRGACKALTQCFFLDTCSDEPSDLNDWKLYGPNLIDEDPKAEALSLANRDKRVYNPVFAPTPPGFASVVEPQKVTPFAAALVKTLNGLGATIEGNAWEVRNTYLPGRFAEVLRWYWPAHSPGDDLYVQPADSGRITVLRRLPDAPSVPFRLDCTPESARVSAGWQLLCRLTDAMRSHGPGQTDMWEDETKASSYDLTVRFDDEEYETLIHPGKSIIPPKYEEKLQINRRTPQPKGR
ncbi:caspase family protein [Streptomyces luteogriseus]|uniref:caspase family protein n=1 Tax=Streptomyces luteogriseus TaxID=68233 RepID=UPI00379E06CF